LISCLLLPFLLLFALERESQNIRGCFWKGYRIVCHTNPYFIHFNL
jgi:hypothetical protein